MRITIEVDLSDMKSINQAIGFLIDHRHDLAEKINNEYDYKWQDSQVKKRLSKLKDSGVLDNTYHNLLVRCCIFNKISRWDDLISIISTGEILDIGRGIGTTRLEVLRHKLIPWEYKDD